MPHSPAGLSYQTWFLGLHHAPGFSVLQLLYKEEKMQIIIFFCMYPPHFQVAKLETETGLGVSANMGQSWLVPVLSENNYLWRITTPENNHLGE